jgi:translation initiation factor IF-2
MSETKETNDKTLSVAPRKPLSLKRTVESGHVRQSFSHGRSKSVVVEKKKKRTISAPGEGEAHGEDRFDQRGGLSSGELDARRRALETAKERAEADARETAERTEREARRAREEAVAGPQLPPPEVTAETPPVEVQHGTAPTSATEATAEPASPPAPAKPELPRGGPIVVLPSAD